MSSSLLQADALSKNRQGEGRCGVCGEVGGVVARRDDDAAEELPDAADDCEKAMSAWRRCWLSKSAALMLGGK